MRAAGSPRLLPAWTWVALAAAVWLGAWLHRPFPWPVGMVVVGVGLVSRRLAVLAIGGALLASGLGAAALAGLAPPTPGPIDQVVTLVRDPDPGRWGVSAEVRAGRRHLLARASGPAAGTLGRAAAGERVRLVGTVHALPSGSVWAVSRHLAGVVAVRQVVAHDAGSWPYRAANRVRGAISSGSSAFDEVARPLYLGFVLGDDRGQRPEIVDDFRGAGLTHLLVVSGQNLAFVLVLVRPVLDRVGGSARLLLTLAVLGGFGLLTRFEPSALRAVAMAAVAVGGSALGRPLPPAQRLGAAVAGLVLVDPLLVWSMGFRLSVAASAGIAVLQPPLAVRLPGPRWWREGLSVTLAAQAGVAPLIIPAFGGMPVVAVAANLVAEPVAGLVTTWGLPAGLLAGMAGPRAAALLHVPTRAGIAWVALVARVAARAPLGLIDGRHAVAGGLALGLAAGLARIGRVVGWRRARAVRLVSALPVVVVILHPAWVLAHQPALVQPIEGVAVSRGTGSTVVAVRAWPDDAALLQALREVGVRRIDLLIGPGRPADDTLRALGHRWPPVLLRTASADPGRAPGHGR